MAVPLLANGPLGPLFRPGVAAGRHLSATHAVQAICARTPHLGLFALDVNAEPSAHRRHFGRPRRTLEIVGSAMPSATISGLAIADIIDLASVAPGSGGSAVLTSGNVLDVVEGGSTYVLNLNPSQKFSGTRFVLSSDGVSGTDNTLAKVARGQLRPA